MYLYDNSLMEHVQSCTDSGSGGDGNGSHSGNCSCSFSIRISSKVCSDLEWGNS